MPKFDSTTPYLDLPRLPPEQSLISVDLLNKLIPAAEKLAKLSAIAAHLPNPRVLFENVMMLEAKDSSEIENIVTTNEKLFAAMVQSNVPDRMTKEVQRYSQAIKSGWEEQRPLCTNTIEEICSIIKDKPMTVRKVPGTALTSLKDGSIIYTPPDGETLLRDLLDNLFEWMHDDSDNLHPIIKAAIAHYQFESIHPFTDGNGRTGRIMIVLYLVEKQILSSPVLFLSSIILKYKDLYYLHLQTTRESGDFIPYLDWFISVISMAASESNIRALNVETCMMQTKNIIRNSHPQIYSQDLVNVIFLSPFIYAYFLVDTGIVRSISTAHSYLKKLAELGILEVAPWRINRKTCYVNSKLLSVLTKAIE